MVGIAFRDVGRLSVTSRIRGEGKEVRTSGTDGGGDVRPCGREDIVGANCTSERIGFGSCMVNIFEVDQFDSFR